MTFSQSEDICRAIKDLTKSVNNITHELSKLNSKIDSLSVVTQNSEHNNDSDIRGIFTDGYKPKKSGIKGAFLQD